MNAVSSKKNRYQPSGLITDFVFFGVCKKLGHYQPLAPRQISTSTTRIIIRLIRMLMTLIFFMITYKLNSKMLI